MNISFDAEKLRKLAEQQGDSTIDQIAKRTGVDSGLLSRLFAGHRQPRFATAVKLADAYGEPMAFVKRDTVRSESAA